MHVFHVIETLGTGGAEHLLHTNLKHLDPARVQSTVVTVSSGDDHWAGPIRALGIPVVSLDCRVPAGVPKAAARLHRLVRRHRPDLIHTHIWSADVAGRVAGRLTGVPVISSVHSVAHEPAGWDDGSGVSRRSRVMLRELDRWTARLGCRRMIAVSARARASAIRRLGMSPSRIDVLENPIDLEELDAPPRQTREELLREWGLAPDSVILLHVGRLSPEKGLVHAIRALPEIVAAHPRAHLVSSGSTANAAWVRHLSSEAARLGVADRFHVLGSRSGVVDLLRACDVFVFPSLAEGLGLALVEAMAVGCACVVSGIRPLSDVVQHDVSGWLVPPRDPSAIARAAAALAGDPVRRRGIGDAARRSARARFEPRAAAERLLGIYEDTLGLSRSLDAARPGLGNDRVAAGRGR